MTDVIDSLARVLAETPARLVQISEEDAGRGAPGRWSRKEVLGHLIDSASNNHQRFVRAMAVERLEFPKYDQEHWVASQSYATEPWPDLVNLWLLYNRHLLHVLRAIPADKLRHTVVIGENAPLTVEALARDYVAHLQHHLAGI